MKRIRSIKNNLLISIFLFFWGVIRAGAEMPVLTDVRAEGLGGAGTAVITQSTALDWNPAGLGHMRKTDVTALYSKGFVDTQYTNLSFGFPVSFGGIACGWGRVSNEFEKTSAQDDPLGVGTVSNDVVAAGFGYNRLPVALGLSVRYFSEKVDPVLLSGYAVDAGALYEYKKCRFGWAWKNILSDSLRGTGMAGDSVSETIPPAMRAGAAVVLPVDFDVRVLGDGKDQSTDPDIWHFTLAAAVDVEIPIYRRQTLAASPGLELAVGDVMAIRMGLRQCRDFRAGMSLKTAGISFDYAYVFNPSLTSTHVISTSLYFGSQH